MNKTDANHTFAASRTVVLRGFLAACFWSLLMFSAPLPAVQIGGRPGDDVVTLILAMKPGDELILASGTYKSTRYQEIKNMHGTKDAWFTIRGVDGGRVVIENDIKENTFNITDCSFFRFYNLEITGTKGDACFKWGGKNSDMIVESCYMHNMGGQAINCSNVDSMHRLRVSYCHIAFTGGHGEGFYLGHQDASGSVFDSLFECNLIHDLGGKRGSGFEGDGFDVNPGCLGNTIRYNAIYRSLSPGICIENIAAGKPNIVEGNMVWDCLDDANIQLRGNAIVKDNIVRGGKLPCRFTVAGVQESNNVEWDPAQVSSDEMLVRGVTMIKTRWAEIQKTGGGRGPVRELPGLASLGKAAMAAGALRPGWAAPPPGNGEATASAGGVVETPPVPQFKPEAVAALRKEAIACIVAQLKTHEPLALELMIEKEPALVTLLPSDPAVGLQVKLLVGGKKTIAWENVETATLGELLYALTGNGETESPTLGGDLLAAALCSYVGERSMQVAEQLQKLDKVDPALQEQYKQRAGALK